MVAKLSGVAAGLLVSDGEASAVTAANQSADTALENNAILLLGVIATVAYTTYEGDGNPIEGLGKIGSGEDAANQAMAEASHAVVAYSIEHSPETTKADMNL